MALLPRSLLLQLQVQCVGAAFPRLHQMLPALLLLSMAVDCRHHPLRQHLQAQKHLRAAALPLFFPNFLCIPWRNRADSV